jgi:hypothetical protein
MEKAFLTAGKPVSIVDISLEDRRVFFGVTDS